MISELEALSEKLHKLDSSSTPCYSLDTLSNNEIQLVSSLADKLIKTRAKLVMTGTNKMIVYVIQVKDKLGFVIKGEPINGETGNLFGIAPECAETQLQVLLSILNLDLTDEQKEHLILYRNYRRGSASISSTEWDLYDTDIVDEICKGGILPYVSQLEYEYAFTDENSSCAVDMFNENILFLTPRLFIKELMKDKPDTKKLSTILEQSKVIANKVYSCLLESYENKKNNGTLDINAETVEGDSICEQLDTLCTINMCLSALENKTIIKDFRTRYKDSNYDTIALCELFSELYIDILTNLIGSEPLELSTPQEIFDNAIELLKELNSGKNIVTGVTINGEDIEFDYDPILSEKCKYLSPRCYDPDIDAE